jgi:hypothetical protein
MTFKNSLMPSTGIVKKFAPFNIDVGNLATNVSGEHLLFQWQKVIGDPLANPQGIFNPLEMIHAVIICLVKKVINTSP